MLECNSKPVSRVPLFANACKSTRTYVDLRMAQELVE